MLREGRVIVKGACVQMCFCIIDYNCIIILLSVIVCVCHDKGNVFVLFLDN